MCSLWCDRRPRAHVMSSDTCSIRSSVKSKKNKGPIHFIQNKSSLSFFLDSSQAKKHSQCTLAYGGYGVLTPIGRCRVATCTRTKNEAIVLELATHSATKDSAVPWQRMVAMCSFPLSLKSGPCPTPPKGSGSCQPSHLSPIRPVTCAAVRHDSSHQDGC